MQSGMAWVWGIIIAIVVLGGGYLLWANSQGTTGTSDTNVPVVNTIVDDSGSATDIGSSDTSGTNQEPPTTAPMSATVAYNGTSFEPKTVTIAKGGTVTWQNRGSGSMWVASARHPDHTVYAGTTRDQHCPGASETAFDQCESGASYSFMFNKTGTWNYHDHTNASVFGTVVVE